MEFEGSCPQDTVGLVVLKGLSLSASTRENSSTRENKSAFCDLSTLHGTEGSLANNSTQE
ncbi:hypothetical protein NC653_028587 [Populus alba x Populus x berolinensis]|uniref:Uncharacterized protein n=1 Tax=Populus alba x Populus x berolinensis TaxID=444605 RepID=A0AAD6Q2F4_9ROSI|nr:hypothetical protein NC653_028587 [Populus alba x Populus x berolinensis]